MSSQYKLKEKTSFDKKIERIFKKMREMNTVKKCRKIYAASIAAYFKDGDIKLGMTDLDDVLDRLRQLDSTGSRDPWFLLKWWEVPDWLTDKMIHEYFENRGKFKVRSDKDREFFNVTVEDVDIAINDLLYGIARPWSFEMRPEQKECITKISDLFLSGASNQALINAIMRFGKCSVALRIAKAIGAKRTLVMTYKPTVSAGWRDDLTKHVEFEGWDYLYHKDFDNNNPVIFPNSDKPAVLFVSFQDINNMDKKKWQFIKDYHFDFLIIDEMHYGSDTDTAIKTINSLNYSYIAYVSGTPLEALMSGRFTENEIFNWSYIDEQRAKRAEREGGYKTTFYKNLPTIKFHSFKIAEAARKIQTVYSDAEGFTMTKMLASDDGKTFKEQASVSIFVDQLLGKHLPSIRYNNPNKILGQLNHFMIYMPNSTKSVDAMCALLESKHGYGAKIINASGNNIKDIDVVRKIIAQNERTITVTCGRFNTGSSVPEWDAVVMLDDTKAAETVWQTAFRSKTPNEEANKEFAYVIDFNPSRTLSAMYDYAYYNTPKGGKPSETLREFLEFAPVLEHDDNGITEIDLEAVIKSFSSNGDISSKFGSASIFNWRNVNDDITSIFDKIFLDKQGNISQVLSDNDLNKGKNFEQTGPKTPGVKSVAVKPELDLRMLRQKILQTFQRVPTYLFIEDTNIESADDIISVNNDELFEKVIGIKLDEFKFLCDNFITIDKLDRAIAEYNNLLRA
jgi:superfamily II DNA or RNA helicase